MSSFRSTHQHCLHAHAPVHTLICAVFAASPSDFHVAQKGSAQTGYLPQMPAAAAAASAVASGFAAVVLYVRASSEVPESS